MRHIKQEAQLHQSQRSVYLWLPMMRSAKRSPCRSRWWIFWGPRWWFMHVLSTLGQFLSMLKPYFAPWKPKMTFFCFFFTPRWPPLMMQHISWCMSLTLQRHSSLIVKQKPLMQTSWQSPVKVARWRPSMMTRASMEARWPSVGSKLPIRVRWRNSMMKTLPTESIWCHFPQHHCHILEFCMLPVLIWPKDNLQKCRSGIPRFRGVHCRRGLTFWGPTSAPITVGKHMPNLPICESMSVCTQVSKDCRMGVSGK